MNTALENTLGLEAIRAMSHRLRRRMGLLSMEDVDDLVQDGLLRLFERPPERAKDWSSSEALVYVWKTIRNRQIDEFRNRQKRNTATECELGWTIEQRITGGRGYTCEDIMDSRRLIEELSQIDDADVVAALDSIVMDKSYEKIAMESGIKVSSARAKVSRGKRKMVQYLAR